MSEIIVQSLSKTFFTKDGEINALKDVNLSIQKGDIYGIIGLSGAGKSTLVRCLNFLEVPTEGNVIIQNQNLSTLSATELRNKRKDIGMIFQHFNLLMQKNVLENICFPLYLQKKSKKEARTRAEELLRVVGLSEKKYAYPAQLSGGQKQRVAIARALALNPSILLCDEATSALDPQTTTSILNLLKEINQDFGITIILITHEMAVVRQICSHVAIMSGGMVVENGSVSDIFAHPKSQMAKDLILHDTSEDSFLNKELKQTTIKKGGQVLRIIFSEHTSFEPVLANMILSFNEQVNILRANIKNVGGRPTGEMVLEFDKDCHQIADIQAYFKNRGIEVEEVFNHV